MKTSAVTVDDLRGVFPVPPLCRNASRGLDWKENQRLADYMAAAGITRFLYGGNAFLYHISLEDYEELIDWLADFDADLWPIPSVGPSFGRALDQAAIVKRASFPCAMVLPCADPRDAAGLEAGYREIAERMGCPLICYLKDESNFGSDKEAGLDVVARLIEDEVAVAIKYAVVRQNPEEDGYLNALLERVDRRYVISGIGERPAIVHMHKFDLPGFTTGSGCVAPRLSQELFESNLAGDWKRSEEIRQKFLPLEDLRDSWSPSKVLHQATELAGIAKTGPLLPYLSPLSEAQVEQLAPVALRLAEQDALVPA